MYVLNDENVEEAAVCTLTNIWSCIDWSKVTGTRAMGIWDEFSNKVKASAMTTTDYDTFVEKLCRKMEISSLRWKDISEISDLDEAFKKAVLNVIRNKTQVIILKLRLNNQIRKKEAEEEKLRKVKAEALEKKMENVQVAFDMKGVKAHEN